MKKKKIFIFLVVLLVTVLFTSFRLENIVFAQKVIRSKNKQYTILVDLLTDKMQVFKNDTLIKEYSVSGGKPSTPSPIGTWTIISKDTWGEGFGGRWMGFNVPWGKYGIHGTIYPNSVGWNSSHGCIRMRNKKVAELYKFIPHGTKVIIYGGPYGNFGSYLRQIRPGMTGSDIYEIQKMLKEKGYFKGNPNGVYNNFFKSVIHKFQKDNKIPITDTISSSFYKKLGVNLVD